VYLLYEVERSGWEKKTPSSALHPKHKSVLAHLTELKCHCVWVRQECESFLDLRELVVKPEYEFF
jgi:hypothetical protein